MANYTSIINYYNSYNSIFMWFMTKLTLSIILRNKIWILIFISKLGVVLFIYSGK